MISGYFRAETMAGGAGAKRRIQNVMIVNYMRQLKYLIDTYQYTKSPIEFEVKLVTARLGDSS